MAHRHRRRPCLARVGAPRSVGHAGPGAPALLPAGRSATTAVMMRLASGACQTPFLSRTGEHAATDRRATATAGQARAPGLHNGHCHGEMLKTTDRVRGERRLDFRLECRPPTSTANVLFCSYIWRSISCRRGQVCLLFCDLCHR